MHKEVSGRNRTASDRLAVPQLWRYELATQTFLVGHHTEFDQFVFQTQIVVVQDISLLFGALDHHHGVPFAKPVDQVVNHGVINVFMRRFRDDVFELGFADGTSSFFNGFGLTGRHWSRRDVRRQTFKIGPKIGGFFFRAPQATGVSTRHVKTQLFECLVDRSQD